MKAKPKLVDMCPFCGNPIKKPIAGKITHSAISSSGRICHHRVISHTKDANGDIHTTEERHRFILKMKLNDSR